MDYSTIVCDEIKSVGQQRRNEQILMKKEQSPKHKISIFYLPFY